MCTVITLSRPGTAWPLLLAANRDERVDRAWDPPERYWSDRPHVVAGRDRSGGGTWMAVSDTGLVAAVLNRPGSLGPARGKRSRGELPLLALDHATAEKAADAIRRLDGREFRSFNLVVADRAGCWFLRNDDAGILTAAPLTSGLHMVTAQDPDTMASGRVARHLPRFQKAPPPEPPDWGTWASLLADDSAPRDAALSVPPLDGFGTVCSSLLALPADGPPQWLFARGRPGHAPFAPIGRGGKDDRSSPAA